MSEEAAAPQVSPDLAAKVVAAETRNVIKGVGDGGTLPAAHRKAMQALSMTPDSAAKLRVACLLQRWVDGHDLTDEQWAEIAAIHPEYATGRPPQAPRPEAKAAPEASPKKYTAAQIDAFAETYGSKRREIYRWMQRGRDKGEIPPLDDPTKMPGWWGRNMKHRVPDKIALAAAAARPVAPPPSLVAEEVASQGGNPLILSALEITVGESVKQARMLTAAAFQKLEKAYETENVEDIQLWQVRWEKAVEAQRKQERDDRLAAEQAGLLISRAAVDSDIANAIAMLKIMRESMAPRILSRLPDLPVDLREPLRLAIEDEREKEDALFRNLESLKAKEDVDFALAS